MARNRHNTIPNWQPLERTTSLTFPDEATLRYAMKHELIDDEYWKNDIYTVNVKYLDDFVHLSIKRNDRKPCRNWRHFQWIKNQLVGEECEGLELYPAESRLVDNANQYHMWVLREPGKLLPVGWTNRVVSANAWQGMKQEPWPENMKPPDLKTMTMEEADKWAEEQAKEQGNEYD